MLLSQLFTDPIGFIALVVSLIIGITVHEAAHAWTANQLGDPTAKYMGRISLNPKAHLDPIGSLMLLLAGFGWGKPVPVNSQYFSRPALDELIVALAGPISNFLVATILGLLIRLIGPGAFSDLAVLVIYINILLMLFNLLPIPPLDGSKVLRIFLDEDTFNLINLYSLPLILVVLYLINTTGLGDWLIRNVAALTLFLTGGA